MKGRQELMAFHYENISYITFTAKTEIVFWYSGIHKRNDCGNP
jgi:hypothetical protein